MGTLLAYYKLKDTIADEGLFKKLGALCALPVAAIARNKAKQRCPAIDTAVAEMMARQQQVEQEKTASIDRAAEPFALLLQTLAASVTEDEKQRQVLERFGYCLGRWIYLMDAVDDLPRDLEQGRYNPYIGMRQLTRGDTKGVKEAREYALLTLNACLAECTAAYQLLNIRRFDGLLSNILEQGMSHAQKRVIAGEEVTHERSL